MEKSNSKFIFVSVPALLVFVGYKVRMPSAARHSNLSLLEASGKAAVAHNSHPCKLLKRTFNPILPVYLDRRFSRGGEDFLPPMISASIDSMGTTHMSLGQFFKQNPIFEVAEP